MNIEQAIYTHTKVRRDTRSTGFGYYSMTPGMERLLSQSARLAAVSAEYISPRNSDLWWEKDEQELTKRDDTEAARIREHHPVCCGYTAMDIGGEELAVLTFGRNLGRDLSPLTRDGNILVNTLALPYSEIKCYPYEYYGSRELFIDCERGFFLAAPDEPAADLVPLQSITKSSTAPTAGDIESFLNDEERLPILCSMLSALMRINDGGSLRRMIVCDSKENMIYWIAALSLVFPVETAKRFTFRTYSFFGSNADDFSAVYDDAMFCGAYTPTVNGDPASPRATNYDLNREISNSSTAVFDLEQGYTDDTEDSYPYFSTFIESAFSTDMRILTRYHDFITERTSCRSLGSDYAKGYGCYTILQLRNERSLKYLRDAFDFALGYMGRDTLRELLSVAYSCTIDAGKESAAFEDILAVSNECVEKGIADEGLVRAHYISFLIRLLTCDDTAQEDYLRLRERIKPLFESIDTSFDEELVSAFTVDGIMQMTLGEHSGWKYSELALSVCRLFSKGGSYCGTQQELMKAFGNLGYKHILTSDTDERRKVITDYTDMLRDPTYKTAFLKEMYTAFEGEHDVRRELVGCAAELCVCSEDSGFIIPDAVGFVYENGECRAFCKAVTQAVQPNDDISQRAGLYERLITLSDGMLDECFDIFVSDLDARAESGQSHESIYLVYDLARRCKKTECIDLASLCRRYYRAAAAEYGIYGIRGKAGQRLLEMASALPEPSAVLRGIIGNMVTLLYIRAYADEPDTGRIPIHPDKLQKIVFDLMKKPERSDCISLLGGAFAQRSVILGSALEVRYDLFVNTNDSSNEEMLCEIFTEWMTVLAERQLKTSPLLIGQVLAMSAVECRIDTKTAARVLYDLRIKLSDVKKGMFTHEVMSYLDDRCGDVTGPKAYLTKMMSEIEDFQSGKRTSSPFKKHHS